MKHKITLFFLLLSFLFLPAFLTNAQETPPLRLTELFYNTPGDDSQEEWIEIANLGTAVYDLSSISIGDEEKAGGGEGMARFPANAEITPGQVIVVAQTAVSFYIRYGFYPDYELNDTSPDIPNMRTQPLWASGSIALANNGDELLLLDGLTLIDALGYGDSTAVFTPAISTVFSGQSLARIPANCDSDTAADWKPQTTPTPGTITLEGECATPLQPETAETLPPIGSIQGHHDTDAAVNQIVTFRGVVTAVTADRNTNGITFYTFFVQDLPGFEDSDPTTSDAIPVFTGTTFPSVTIGDQVRITGQVTEFFGLTEIDDNDLHIQLEAANKPLPLPIPLQIPTLPTERLAYLESLEGMRVTLAGAEVIGPTYSGCGFAVWAGSGTGVRPYRQQATDDPGTILSIQHQTDADCGNFPHVKTGDTTGALTGILTYTFDQYRLITPAEATIAITPASLSPLPQPPKPANNQFSAATFNLENYFDTVDNTGTPAEPKPSPEELAVKQTKLAYTIGQILGCPTLLAVQEVENAALLAALADVAAPMCGFTYQVVHQESPDARGIDVALLVNPRQVVVDTAVLQQGCTPIDTGIDDPHANCSPGQHPLFSRPPLQVTASVQGDPVTIIVVHFKSKRGGEAETAPRRMAQAAHVRALVADMVAANPETAVIVMGDFNDYNQSPTLQTLTQDGLLTNLLGQLPEESRYSFNFGGVRQLIDGILVSPALQSRVTAVAIQHTNADYPDLWGSDTADYLPYKSSDHDPSIAVFTIHTTAPPETADASPQPPIPTLNPTTSPTPRAKSPLIWLALAAWLLAMAGLVRIWRK
ncbi:MAG: hypothetical protein Kow0080_27300 [Candidatus Promineifilaceae bacterium]